jgi:hypothetical protein
MLADTISKWQISPMCCMEFSRVHFFSQMIIATVQLEWKTGQEALTGVVLFKSKLKRKTSRVIGF